MTSVLPIFLSGKIRLVCISDTHNDDPSAKIPLGDIFIHAGDMVNKGTFEELKIAFEWIAALPHKIKVIVAGNNDRGLKNGHLRYSAEAHGLFTSDAAKSQGIHYLMNEVRTVAYYTAEDGTHRPIKVYGNPGQPNFQYDAWLGTPGQAAFDYPPHPSQESLQAWSDSPSHYDDVPIWVMHGAPLDRLDVATKKGLMGCPAQLEKISAARPMLCVFGHFHYSYGLERVEWSGGDQVLKAEKLVLGEERRRGEGDGGVEMKGTGGVEGLMKGRETLFLNASWMTSDKSREERNPAVALSLKLE